MPTNQTNATATLERTANVQAPPSPSASHLINDIPYKNADGTINAVIEIPSGTDAKWETDKNSGQLYQPNENGKPRTVHYLPYVANYGFVPQTLSDPEKGGDGDPLDVVVLGPQLAKGAIVPTHAVGVIRLVDHGEQDDKLVLVPNHGPFKDVRTLNQLKHDFPGVLGILETWFLHYKPLGKMRIDSIADEKVSADILEHDHGSWKAQQA